METLKRTCLYDSHVALGAQMSPFGGFMMPIQYSDIILEHKAVRQSCGMFDVSHMGEISVSGPDAGKFVDHIFTNDVAGLAPGHIRYGMMLYPEGGVVDDLLVYGMDGRYLLVVNAANTDKDFAWISEAARGYDVSILDESGNYGQIALQGPDSQRIASEVLGFDVSELVFYTFIETDFAGGKVIVSRSGYTGEDGFEIYGSAEYINKVWDILVGSKEVAPCGLGCRDTLRFEVALPLYGHELSQDITPIEAGLGSFVKMDKPEFIGKEAIAQQKEHGIVQKVVGIELHEKAVPRSGYDIEVDGVRIGYVTTGYQSISTGKSVCMALIDNQYAALGTEVDVRIRKKTFKGTVCKKRFYQKNYKK